MIKRVMSWVKTSLQPKPDPLLEQLVRWYAQQVSERLTEQRDSFDFDRTLSALEADPRLADFIADRAYRSFLRRAWEDGSVSDGEKRTLAWISAKLGISAARATEIDAHTANTLFSKILDAAVSDGELSDSEVARLGKVAQGAGATLQLFAQQHLQKSGRGLVDRLVLLNDEAATIAGAVWQRFLAIGARLGLNSAEFLAALRPASLELLDDVLQRIRGDSALDDDELRLVNSLIDRLNLGAEARARVTRATATLTRHRKLEAADIRVLASELNRCESSEALVPTFTQPWSTVEGLRTLGNKAMWWEILDSELANAKYNAGAGLNVDRSPVRVSSAVPRQLKVENPLFGLSAVFGTVYFLPVGVLRLGGNGRFDGAEYRDFTRGTTLFVESSTVPPNATIADYTWQFVNKSGGPDMRFKDNRKLPLCRYADIRNDALGLHLNASLEQIQQVFP